MFRIRIRFRTKVGFRVRCNSVGKNYTVLPDTVKLVFYAVSTKRNHTQ